MLKTFRIIYICTLTAVSGFLLTGCSHEPIDNVRGSGKVPILKMNDTTMVDIYHPSLKARWRIRLPEAVGTEDTLLFYPSVRNKDIVWKELGNGWIGYYWKPPVSDKGLEEIDFGGEVRNYSYGAAVAARIKPGPDRIDLIIEVTNLTNEPLRNLWSDGGDLQHRSLQFIDKNYNQTYIKSVNGLVALSETTRTQGIRSIYVFNNKWYETPIFKRYEYFWGRSTTAPISTLIASEADDGAGAVGIGYEHAFKLMQNSDSHNCMHSGPLFGKILPGETKIRRGVILFGQSVHELFDRYASIGYVANTAAP